MPSDSPERTPDEDQAKKPTTVRLGKGQRTELDSIAQESGVPKNTLLSLAVDALIDFVRRTGKLPVPNAKKRRQTTHGSTKG